MLSLRYLIFVCVGAGGCSTVTVEEESDHGLECDGTQQGGRCLRILAKEYTLSLLVHGSSLYFARLPSDDGTPIHRVPVAGGDVSKLIDTERALDLVADNANLYWCRLSVSGQSNGALMQAPLDGGKALELVAPLPTPQQVAVDDANVYWTDNDLGSLNKLSKSGGPPVAIVSDRHPRHPVVFGNHVYYIEDAATSAIARVPIVGGTPEILATETNNAAGGLAVHATGAYWVNDTDGTLNRIPHNGQRQVLATWQGTTLIEGSTVRVDDSGVYWSTSSVLRKMPHGSTTPEVMIRDDFSNGFVIDETHAYWPRTPDNQIVSLGPK